MTFSKGSLILGDYTSIVKDTEDVFETTFEEEAKKPPPPFLNPEKKVEAPVLDPDSKPTVSEPSLGNEFETHSDAASGAVTFEQPAPLTTQGHLDKRDGILVNGIIDEKGAENEDK